MQRIIRKENGFTLIDVIVTIAIVLALAVGSFVSYGNLGDRAKQAVTEAAAQQVYDAAGVMLHEKSRTPQEASSEFNQRHEKVTTTVTGENCVTARHDDGQTATRGDRCGSTPPDACDVAEGSARGSQLATSVDSLRNSGPLLNGVQHGAAALATESLSAPYTLGAVEVEVGAVTVDVSTLSDKCGTELEAAHDAALNSARVDGTISTTLRHSTGAVARVTVSLSGTLGSPEATARVESMSPLFSAAKPTADRMASSLESTIPPMFAQEIRNSVM